MCKLSLCLMGLLAFTLIISSVELTTSPNLLKKCHTEKYLALNNIAHDILSTFRLASILNNHCNIVSICDTVHSLATYFSVSARILSGRRNILGKGKLSLLYVCVILILLASDTESNPGPDSGRNDLCGVCNTEVKWHPDRGIFCEDCNTWFHAECQGMNSLNYQFHCNNPDEFWQCWNCGIPHFTSSLFESSTVDTDQSMSSISSSDSEQLSPIPSSLPTSKPAHSSTPHSKQSSSQDPPSNNRQPKSNTSRLPKLKHLKIITVNCRSIVKNKLGFLSMVSSVKPDIVLGCESWLKPKTKDAEIFPSDYSVYRNDRKRRTGGGVFVLVSKKYSSSLVPELKSNSEILWVNVKQQGKRDLLVCSAYRPDADFICIDELDRTLSMIDTNVNTVVIGGDMNLGDIDWENHSVKSGGKHVGESCKLLDFADTHNLYQTIREPTRIIDTVRNCLDLLFISNSSLLENTKVIPGFSDHCIPYIDILTSVRINPKEKRKIYLFDKANWSEMKKGLEDFTASTDFTNMSVQELWDIFKEKLDSLKEKFIPAKTVSGKHHIPWLNANIRKLMKKRDRIYGKMKKSCNPSHLSKYRKIKTVIQKQTRKAYWEYMNNIVCDKSENKHGTTRKFWGFIKSLRNDSSGVAPLRENGLLRNSSKEKADALNRQFSSVFVNDTSSAMPHMDTDPSPAMSPLHVTERGVFKLLEDLNPNKAAGPDSIKPRILKECAREIAPIFTILFNKSLESGTVPTDWKEAFVSPIFKKGERFLAKNYRPVSLTCIACKVLEHIVVSNVLDHCDTYNILVDNQHGFRARRSCETQLVGFINDLAKASQKSQIDVAIMDFSKAFDVVHHGRLMHKLSHYGITGDTLAWIGAFLGHDSSGHRNQQVVLDGSASHKAKVMSGVPQGSVLGPLLFLLYINDLPRVVRSGCRLFADDCVIYRVIRSPADSQELQRDLDSLAEWEQKWKMSFNIDKCHIMYIASRNRRVNKTQYTLHNQPLQAVDQATYLGVEITSDLSWGAHVNKITSKASQTLGFLKRNLHSASKETKTAAYHSLVRPTLEYSVPAWNPHAQKDKDKLESVQKSAARFVTNNYKDKTPGSMSAILTSLNWPTLESRRATYSLVLFYKIVNNKVDLNMNDYLKPQTRQSRHYHNQAYQRTSPSNDIYKYSFFPYTLSLWNPLPQGVVSVDSVSGFKSALAAHTQST